jgi:thiol:disulfide interchange protein DsbD
MMDAMRRILLSVLWLLIAALPAAAQAPKLLPVEEAFRISVTRESAERLQFHWQIADGYYMYREFLEARNAADSAALSLETDAGIVEEADANFGASEVYYGSATGRVDVAGVARLAITYQGCKKDSICYPPVTQVVDTASLHLSEAVVGYSIDSVDSSPSGGTSAGFAIDGAVQGEA